MYISEMVDIDIEITPEMIWKAIEEDRIIPQELFTEKELLKAVTMSAKQKDEIINSIKDQELTHDELREIREEINYWVKD